MGLWDDLWPNLEFSPESVKRRKFLHWVEKTHDNDMADKTEKAERVVRQDIFKKEFSSTSLCPRIHLGSSDRKKRNSSRGPHWKGKKTGVGGECKKKVIISCMCKTAMFLVLEFTAVRGADPFPGLVEAYCAHIPGYIWAPLNRTAGNPRQRKLKQDMLSPRSRGNSPGRHHNQVPGIWEHCGEHLRNLHRLAQWPSRCKKKGECPPWSRPVAGRQSR